MTGPWQRSQRAAAVGIGDVLVLVGRARAVRRLDGDSATLAREVLAYLAAPRSTDEVVAHVESIAGPLGERADIVRQLLALLAESGAIEPVPSDAMSGVTSVIRAGHGSSGPGHTPDLGRAGRAPDAGRAASSDAGDAAAGRVSDAGRDARDAGRGVNVVVGVSGAIAATHAPALVLALQRRGYTVEVALTATAQRFVAPDALTAIVRRELHTSVWPRAPHLPVPHVALAAWADLVIVYPASATTLGRIANGDFSDVVAATALTTRAPVVIAPSMNEAMLASPAVQRNLARLRDDGHAIVHGVPSQEAADAPEVRNALGGAAPSPVEVVGTIDALRAAGMLATGVASRAAGMLATNDASLTAGTAERAPHAIAGRRDQPHPRDHHAWDAAYRQPLVPWASERCDDDLAAALAAHAPARARLLDVGCGLGQVARQAAHLGHRVVAIDTSEVALALASRRAVQDEDGIVWLRDDICASALVGPFDVIVDRATLHALPAARVAAWAAGIARLAAPRAIVIVKAHADGMPGATTGWTAARLAGLLPGFAVIADTSAELPGLADPTPIASRLVVLARAPR